MIVRKSLKAWGRDYKISPHFTLKEMACKDGSDIVFYSTELMAGLEALRAYVGGSVTITSGYRTAAYNRKIGGASSSQHIKGTAADIIVKKNGDVIPAKLICCLCQSLGFSGIGFISNTAVHVDMRESGSYRGDERKGYGGNVGGDFYRYFGVSKEQVEALRDVPVTEPKQTSQEEEEMIYKTINDVPKWGKAAVQLRIDHGWSDGKNLPEGLVRAWVSIDREDPYIANRSDAPSWAKKDINELIDNGVLKGTKVEEIGLRLSDLRVLIIVNRMIPGGDGDDA